LKSILLEKLSAIFSGLKKYKFLLLAISLTTISVSFTMSARGPDDIQKQIQRDWANREYIEVMTSSIKKITDFLNGFDLSCRSRLASLNEKLTNLERRMEYVEALVTVQETATE